MGGRYRSFSGRYIDPEKTPEKLRKSFDSSISDDDYLANGSSSALMLSSSKHKSKPTYAYHLPRRRFTRYFTLAVTSLLGLFIWWLISSSYAARAEVELGLRKPPPPPAFESFPFLKRYHGGIRSLVSREENEALKEYPVSEDEELKRLQEEALRQKEKEDKVVVRKKGFNKRDVKQGRRFDPYSRAVGRGIFEEPVKCYVDNTTQRTVPLLLGYEGVPRGFPDPIYGSYELLGLRSDVCFERYGRLGPYGYGYSKKFGGSGAGMEGEKEGSEQVWGDELEIDYRNVKWAEVQERCLQVNAHRYRAPPKPSRESFTQMSVGDAAKRDPTQEQKTLTVNGKQFENRTAVIIRTWWDYQYDDEDLFYLRALVNELAIQTGGEYTVHFLVHVKDDNAPIWSDEETYQRILRDSLPAEFHGMGTLWSERQMGLIYGGLHESFYRDLPVHGAYRSTYMPVQYFAHMHPEYEFFWHWEMDVRYTGNFFHLFKQVSEWARKQPRKELWERNGRFYIPSEHGSWEDFRHMVRVQTEHGTAHGSGAYNKAPQDAAKAHPLDKAARQPEPSVWGPLPPTGEGDETDRPELDPKPPTTYDADKYEWGVEEEADFITFNPLFDPHQTNWILAEDTTGYNTDQGQPPRRTAIITASRLSKRLLETMHRETAVKRHTMFSEMWPGSVALHHGYKAVYAPHPVYIDRAWPTSYLAAIFNNGRNGASGGARTSIFSDERQVNFLGTTWYYHAGHAPNLWKRWLGFKVDNDGGEEWEKANEGRMCLPPMLLHPVKEVNLIYEHREGE
ncbi:hypothetical protein CERZMDRAFT_100815 [Cercospora zeae-maydis SCOH1-5]|uniref:Uncharacterized protein n=1 Tax=Cercospora zeae-maydis SCOH1-5 TaxID=717836 RepID=A0A6A6F6V4_9PEZI|nr:hypothetical protein CERZMDRAFT_100815 [Cercospora zeae-maydis SCOH1-5]